MGDYQDAKARSEGADIATLTSKRLWLVIACATPKCPEKTGVPFEAVRNERTLQRALVEHQGPAYSALGEWGVYSMRVVRTMQSPLIGYCCVCPRCSAAVMAKQNAAVINAIANKVNDKI